MKLFDKPDYELTPLQRVLNTIYEMPYQTTATGNSISQKERNELKYNLTEVIADLLRENGIEYITRTAEGYILEVQHEQYGVIPIELNLKVKNLDFDILSAQIDWETKLQEKKEKEIRKQKEAQQKADRAAMRAKKRKVLEPIGQDDE